MKRRAALCLIAAMTAVLLMSCLPQGGGFGHGDKTPRPEFAGSPMAPVTQQQEKEE